MIRLVSVLGARPQFIKASVVSRAIEASEYLTEDIIHTGQHFDKNMSEVFFNDLAMKTPAYNLNIHGGPHGEMTGRMLLETERILQDLTPDLVLVYGDTNSTLAGALAAVKLNIPVAHVEAGLRSFNMTMPEEINRVLTDHISRWLFTPTAAAVNNLTREGFDPERIIPVGDVMYDAALYFGARVSEDHGVLKSLDLSPKCYILATVHRAANTDNLSRIDTIVTALERTSEELPVVWPMHPRTRLTLKKSGRLAALNPAVRIIDPIGYLDMVQLETSAALIVTDSGGVQKEAFFHKVPCVTLREETEWVELVQLGWNRLAPPTDLESVCAAIENAVGSKGEDVNPYGNGDSAHRIVNHIVESLTL